ncbi:hypothetical protein GLOTRDRAFT_135480 [Gloeophyllum trabeum ATCC 11539]|uniref:Uncharacterized protein n=1 Tax=Gloeophyllum trabeum (strain ATCC 11539 / FP-39264 / Madison 617) TaxID=670483 RepID=S7QN73_GLOTA|nr:uncharacterized protein GLOTRDRAFT_135480 [Gloeophyllum trabeum ATCC 11539]EPQ60877.1 hypothetical protein GLOTRDRAFT_135480 [Gloeophyllum trabeum ATCC 11539]
MSGYNQVCLAGLDTMVLHLHNNSLPPSPSEEGQNTSSYIAITCNTAGIKGAFKTARPPLGDKTPSLNTAVFSTLPPDLYPASFDGVGTPKTPATTIPGRLSRPFPIIIQKALPELPIPSPTEAAAVPSPDSKPLPLPPSPSSTDSPRPQPPLSATADLDREISPDEHDVDIPPPVPSKSQEIHNEPYDIPIPEHPNSPYVPWPSPVRRRIVHRKPSHASVASGSCSAVTIRRNSSTYTRSGARAPEPPELDDQYSVVGAPSCMDGIKGKGKVQALKLKRSFKNLKRAVAKKVSILSKPITQFHCHHGPRSDTPPMPSYQGTPPVLDIRAFTPPSSASDLSVASHPSSAGSRSLAEWLSERRRESLELDLERDEQEEDGRWGMTLDEYERNGSWLELQGDDGEDDAEDSVLDGLTEDLVSPLNFTEESYFDGAESEAVTPICQGYKERQRSPDSAGSGSSSFLFRPSYVSLRRCESMPALPSASQEPTRSNETVVPNASITLTNGLYLDSSYASTDGMLVVRPKIQWKD